jgi:hypothetical protein
VGRHPYHHRVLRGLSHGLLLLAIGLSVVASGCSNARPGLVFSPDQLPPGSVGTAYRAEISIDRDETPVGGASVAPGTLPDGLTLELLPGQVDILRISGTPTAAGTFEFTVSVWCFGTQVSGQTGERTYTITVT